MRCIGYNVFVWHNNNQQTMALQLRHIYNNAIDLNCGAY